MVYEWDKLCHSWAAITDLAASTPPPCPRTDPCQPGPTIFHLLADLGYSLTLMTSVSLLYFDFFLYINISLFITEFLSRDSLHHDMCFTVSWRSRNSRELRCRRHRRRSSLELAFPLLCVFNLYQVKKWSSVWNWISVLGGKNFFYFLLFSCAFLDF